LAAVLYPSSNFENRIQIATFPEDLGFQNRVDFNSDFLGLYMPDGAKRGHFGKIFFQSTGTLTLGRDLEKKSHCRHHGENGLFSKEGLL
jgi:hypothetical protein